jgi:hypothetical protein
MASLLAACASPSTSRPEDNPSVDGLVLRIDTRGGFLPPGYDLTRIPQFSVYSDGLMVMEGAQIAIYPGPALPPVFSMRVNQEGLRRIIEAARDAGLAGADRAYDHPGIADAGTTTFTFIENGRRHVISAYALGLDEPSSLIPESDRKARAALYELQTKVGNPMGWLPKGSLSPEQRFDYRALAVVVSTDPPGEILEQPELTWPLGRTIGELAQPVDNQPALSCFTVKGEDLSSLRPLVERANELTQWNSGGERHWLRFRPLLPDESGCPGGAGG